MNKVRTKLIGTWLIIFPDYTILLRRHWILLRKHTAKLKIKSQRYRNTNDINHTHMKKVGTLQNFLFGIYWWTLKNPKNENFEKMKTKRKIAGNIILPRCTKSHNHMRYSSWDTELDRIFLSFWAILFPPPIP